MAQQRNTSKKYEFCNQGIMHSFDPKRNVYDNLNGGGQISLLDLHLGLVKQANSKDVYIIDSHGFILDNNGQPTERFNKNSLPQKKKSR